MSDVKTGGERRQSAVNFFSVCGICVWYTFPALSYYPAVFLAFALLWILTSDGLAKYIADNAGRFLLIVPYLITALAYMAYSPGDSVFSGNLRATFLGLFCVVLFDYYRSSGNFRTLRSMCLVSLVSYITGSVFSTLVFREDIEQIKETVSVGPQSVLSPTFGTFYSAVFILAGCVFLLLFAKGRFRALGGAGTAASVLVLLTGQFTLSIMLAGLLMLMIPVNAALRPGKVGWAVICVIAAVCFITLTLELSELLLRLSELTPGSYISVRLADMAAYLSSGQSLHSGARLELYSRDIACFIRYPLTGVLTARICGMTPEALPGGHSSLLGLFANYGLAGAPLLCLFVAGIYKKVLKMYEGGPYYLFLCPICFVFVVLSAVNPTFNVQTLCFTMMVIIPSLPLLSPATRPANILI